LRVISINKKSNSILLTILFFGIAFRLLYVLFFSSFFAKAYLGRETIFYSGSDFGSALACFNNLIKHGSYSINLDEPLGYFNRMPGYSFLIGIISSIFPNPYNMYVVSLVQIALDLVSIFLLYKICFQLVKSELAGLVAAFIYATHPIIILWCPVLMSDSLGSFFTLLILYFYSKSDLKNKWFWVGLAIGLGTLIRPQTILTIPIIGLLEFIYNLKNLKNFFTSMLIMGLTIACTYGIYPIRNYVFHKQLILFQDLRGSGSVWNDATVNYMQYIYSVQSKWDPSWTNIMHNEKFTIDKAAFAHQGDSTILMDAIYKAQNCSYTFSCWSGYWKEQLPKSDSACDVELAKTFKLLRDNQIKYNAYHYWVTLPLENLKKCFFKSELSNAKDKSMILKLVPIVFLYRTILLLIGLFAGIWMVLKFKENRKYLLFIILGFTSWYLLICFGSMPQLRNIEMRYLLPVDVLLIIPVALIIVRLTQKFFSKQNNIN
jgi:hypothetical protein